MQSYAHWQLAEATLSLSQLKLNTQQKKIYQSGTFLADIGRLFWDKKFEDSDSEIFAKTLKENCKKDDFAEQLFAMGWAHHVVQDMQGAVMGEIFKTGTYTINCSRIENYFANKTCKSLIDGTISFYINCYLIRGVYKALHGFAPTDQEIFLELFKFMIALNYLASLPESKQKLTAKEEENLMAQVDKLSLICVKNFENITVPSNSKGTQSTFDPAALISLDFLVTDSLSKMLKEFSKISGFEKIGKYDGFDEIVYKINDEQKFNYLLKEATPLANSLMH